MNRIRRPILLNKKLISQKSTFLLIVEIFGFLFGLALYREPSSQTAFEGFKDYTGPVLLKESLSPSVLLRRKEA